MRKFCIATAILTLLVLTTGIPWHTTYANHKPETYMRRAEAVMLLLKNAGIKVDPNASTFGDYPDVLDGQWYVPYIVKGVEMGLLSEEKETGLLYPHRTITRAEFLRMLTRTFNMPTGMPYQFTDVKPDDWFAEFAGLAWKYRLLLDEENPTLLNPDDTVSHEEAILTIYTLLGAEPSLQHVPNMVPVRQEVPDEKKTGFIRTIIDTLRPTPEPVMPVRQPVTEQEHTVQKISSLPPPTLPVMSTPSAVKNAILKLIRERGNPAEKTRKDLLEAVNDVRAQYNLAPLRTNTLLQKSAQKHAKDMHDRGYFSHFTPDGRSYVERIKGAGYVNIDPRICGCAEHFNEQGYAEDTSKEFVIDLNHCSCQPRFSLGENLAKGQISVEQVMEDWLNSQNHRKNILRPQFEEIGIGLFGDIWVQNFGRLDMP